MPYIKIGALLLAATALTPVAAHAAPEDQMCMDLLSIAKDAEGKEIKPEFRDIESIANADVRADCDAWMTRISEDGGTIIMAAKIEAGEEKAATETDSDSATVKAKSFDKETETFSDKKTVSETVEIEKAAIVEGRVVVRVPNPVIGVEQGAPTISVTETPVSVDVEERAAEILVKQKPAKIRVSMPKPTITIEQPAPEIIVQLPPPGVSIFDEEPKVSIRMPEPTVSVSQGEPAVDVNVEARLVDPEDPAAREADTTRLVQTRTERMNATGDTRETSPDSDVTVTVNDAKLQMRGTDLEPTVNFSRAQPRIRYESVDPEIEVTFVEEPTVRLEQTGDPTIRFMRHKEDGTDDSKDRALKNEDDDRMATTSDKAATDEKNAATTDASTTNAESKNEEVEPVRANREPLDTDATRSLLTNRDGIEVDKNTADILVGDLLNREVLGVNGEDVGDVDRVIKQGEQIYVIIEHGGFLGIGDSEVAIPANRLAMRGGELMLIGMSEEEVEALPEFDYTNEVNLGGEDTVRIGTLRN